MPSRCNHLYTATLVTTFVGTCNYWTGFPYPLGTCALYTASSSSSTYDCWVTAVLQAELPLCVTRVWIYVISALSTISRLELRKDTTSLGILALRLGCNYACASDKELPSAVVFFHFPGTSPLTWVE